VNGEDFADGKNSSFCQAAYSQIKKDFYVHVEVFKLGHI